MVRDLEKWRPVFRPIAHQIFVFDHVYHLRSKSIWA